jgi:hypothetical protein
MAYFDILTTLPEFWVNGLAAINCIKINYCKRIKKEKNRRIEGDS